MGDESDDGEGDPWGGAGPGPDGGGGGAGGRAAEGGGDRRVGDGGDAGGEEGGADAAAETAGFQPSEAAAPGVDSAAPPGTAAAFSASAVQVAAARRVIYEDAVRRSGTALMRRLRNQMRAQTRDEKDTGTEVGMILRRRAEAVRAEAEKRRRLEREKEKEEAEDLNAERFTLMLRRPPLRRVRCTCSKRWRIDGTLRPGNALLSSSGHASAGCN